MQTRFLPLAAGFFTLASAPLPAGAHAILMSSAPAQAGQVAAGDTPITLRFNSLIDVKRSRLTLFGPGQAPMTLPVTRGGAGAIMQSRAHLTPGPNRLRWQVLAIDGHITRGDVTFDVR